MLGSLAVVVAHTGLLDSAVSLVLGLAGARERLIALLLRLLSLRRRPLGPLTRGARRDLGRSLRRSRRFDPRDRVLRHPRCLLGASLGLTRPRIRLLLTVGQLPRALLGILRRAQRGLGRLVGLHPLPPRHRPLLSRVADLRLRIGTHRGQLGLQLLGVGQQPNHLTRALKVNRRALQIARQLPRQRSQAHRREADRTIPADTLAGPVVVVFARRGTPASLPKRRLRVVLGQLAHHLI